MNEIAAILALIIFTGLAIFQAALALGAPLGHFAWGGAHRILPKRLRIGSTVSIVIYALCVLIIFERVAFTSLLPPVISTVGAWILVGYFALGIVMNAISRSRPERLTMTPTVSILTILVTIVALS